MTIVNAATTRLIGLLPRAPQQPTPIERSLFAAQHMVFTSMAGTIGSVNLVNGLVVVVTLRGVVETSWLALWFVAVAIHSGLAFSTHFKTKGARPMRSVSGSFLRRSEISVFLVGVTWGIAPAMTLDAPIGAQLFVTITSVGMAAGITAVVSQVPRLVNRFVIGAMAPIIWLSIASGLPYGGTIAGLCVILSITLMLGSAQSFAQLHGQILASREATEARSTLIEAIEAIEDGFVLRGQDNSVILSNSRYVDLFPDDLPPPVQVGPSQETKRPDGSWLSISSQTTGQGALVSIYSDISDLKRRERELIAARLEAEQADEAKSRFLATMSHELRTPLNIVLGFSTLISGDRSGALKPDEIRDYAADINASGHQLLALINDIIEYSKLGFEKFPGEPERVDVREMLTHSVRVAASFMNIEDLRPISLAASSAVGEAIVERSSFQRILVGLITNAMKFRGEDSRIVIRAGVREDGALFISVRDFGIGIPDDAIEKVFEAFYQHETALDRAYGGTGLGLTLCRQLARMHDGDVVLASRLGVGTTATLVLPAEAHVKRAAQLVADVDEARSA